MKKCWSIFLIGFVVFSCTGDRYNPDTYLSENEKKNILWQTVHYSAKLAPQATHLIKFNKEFDWYYERAVAECDIRRYYIAEDGSQFYLITRMARSVWPAREAIGGKLTMDDRGSVKEYEEIFRTWKMAEDSLNTRAFELFDKMVKGEGLRDYYPDKKGDRYIEFPDGRYVFSKELKRWTNPELDSLMAN